MNLIRDMSMRDLEAVNEIYNQAVKLKFSTAHTRPISRKERLDWFREHDPALYPVFVMEAEGMVAGWLAFSPYRKGRQALRSAAEISYYVHEEMRRSGIGAALLKHALGKAPGLGFRSLIAILLEPNAASIALLKKFGFEKWGDMPAVAVIEGKAYNHQFFGLHI